MAQNTDLPPTDDFSYAMQPASQLNLNINLAELPKCPKSGCDGVWIPIQYTSNPRSNVNTIYVVGWFCNGCNANVSYSNGKLQIQTIFEEKNAQM